MAEEPKRRGVTLWGIACWMHRVAQAPFAIIVGGWRLLVGEQMPRWLTNVGGVLLLLSLVLFARAVLLAFGAIGDDPAGRWQELRNSLIVVGVAAGAPFLVWRTILASRQTDINQQTHFTDLYSKAVELLGTDKTVKDGEGGERTVPNIEVRLGAIYALQRIMNQSDADYIPILKTLCAYVRENATWKQEPTNEEGEPLMQPDTPATGWEPMQRSWRFDEERDSRELNSIIERHFRAPEEIGDLKERLAKIERYSELLYSLHQRLRNGAAAPGSASAQRPDIRAALDVICDRPTERRRKHEKTKSVEPPEFNVDWPKDLPPEAVQGQLDHVDAYVTKLRKWASTGERLDFTGAALQGAIRRGSDLRRADLTEALLDGANLEKARMEGAILTSAHLRGAHLTWAHLEGASLFKAEIQRADFKSARMQGAGLSMAAMWGANLSGAKMQRALLIKARMECVVANGAHMQGARLEEAQMQGAILVGAHMQLAYLRGAKLQYADVKSARFHGALLASVDFTNAENLSYDQLASAFGDAATKLPSNLEAQRPRLIAEAGWAEDENPFGEMHARWAAWRAQRGL